MNWHKLIPSPARRRALVIGSEIVLTTVGYFVAFALRFDFAVPPEAAARFAETLPYLLIIRLGLSQRFRLDRRIWQHVGFSDLLHLASVITLGSLLFPALLVMVGKLDGVPIAVIVMDWVLAITFAGAVRVAARFVRERARLVGAPEGKRTFIVGAGDAGEQLLRQILHDTRQPMQVVGIIDDDPAKLGETLHGVPVVGTSEEMRGLVAFHRVAVVLIAIPSAPADRLRRLLDLGVAAGVEVKLLPPFKDLMTSDVRLEQVRDVQIEDLLGRDPVTLDLHLAESDIAGRTILVTGAGGSIGSELARQIARFHPVRLVLYERAESPLYFTHLELAREHPEIDVVPVLASVTNTDRLQQTFAKYEPDCVFHAAAYKHVPMLEWNIVEGVWNNVAGTLRVAQAAARTGTARFVLISTDKAVNPSSILGVTKRIAERIVLELPSLRASPTDFRVVRFGNVLGSDGSVVPLFKRQLAAGGPLTITHSEVRRYFMTIPEAVQLVLQAASLPEAAGRIALLEMGTPVRILDLAEQLIRLAGRVPHQDVKIVFTGLRPGEKLNEELVGPMEKAMPTNVDKIRVVERNGVHGALLAQRLRHLIGVTARRDEQSLVRALSALVPEFQPTASPPVFQQHGQRQGALSLRRAATRRAARSRIALQDQSTELRSGTHGQL